MRRSPLESIKKTADFKKVYKHGRVASNRYFVVYAYPNDMSHARLGLSIGKKTGKAVVRNKLRRWVKEYFRLSEHRTHSDDFVVVARSLAKELVAVGKYGDVEKDLTNLMEQLG